MRRAVLVILLLLLGGGADARAEGGLAIDGQGGVISTANPVPGFFTAAAGRPFEAFQPLGARMATTATSMSADGEVVLAVEPYSEDGHYILRSGGVYVGVRPPGGRVERLTEVLRPGSTQVAAPQLVANRHGDTVLIADGMVAVRPAGGTFGPPQVVPGVHLDLLHSAAVDGSGGVVIAGFDDRGHPVLVEGSVRDGLGSPQAIAEPGYDLRAAGGEDGTRAVLFGQDGALSLVLQRPGAPVPQPVRVATAQQIEPVGVGVDATGRATVAWSAYDGQVLRLRTTTIDRDGHVGEVERIAEDVAGGSIGTSLAVNAAGDAMLGYSTQGRPGGTRATAEVAFRPAGGRFGPSVALVAPDGSPDVDEYAVAMSESGIGAVGWLGGLGSSVSRMSADGLQPPLSIPQASDVPQAPAPAYDRLPVLPEAPSPCLVPAFARTVAAPVTIAGAQLTLRAAAVVAPGVGSPFALTVERSGDIRAVDVDLIGDQRLAEVTGPSFATRGTVPPLASGSYQLYATVTTTSGDVGAALVPVTVTSCTPGSAMAQITRTPRGRTLHLSAGGGGAGTQRIVLVRPPGLRADLRRGPAGARLGTLRAGGRTVLLRRPPGALRSGIVARRGAQIVRVGGGSLLELSDVHGTPATVSLSLTPEGYLVLGLPARGRPPVLRLKVRGRSGASAAAELTVSLA